MEKPGRPFKRTAEAFVKEITRKTRRTFGSLKKKSESFLKN